MTNCHLAFTMLATAIVVSAVALVVAAMLPKQKPKKKLTATGNAKTVS